ncbi:MAG: hypothetical protein ACRD8K_07355 [Nitrososphaeraceae archaeon]
MNILQFNSNFSSILAFSPIAGIPPACENILAQEGAINSEGTINDRMSGENTTKWANATLALVQEGSQQRFSQRKYRSGK